MKAKDNTVNKKRTLSQKLKRVGLITAGIGTAIIAAPVALPAMVVTAGGYLAVAGGILAAATQPMPGKLKSLFA